MYLPFKLMYSLRPETGQVVVILINKSYIASSFLRHKARFVDTDVYFLRALPLGYGATKPYYFTYMEHPVYFYLFVFTVKNITTCKYCFLWARALGT